MDNASFDNSTALYVASGLLTYMNLDGKALWRSMDMHVA